MTKEITESLANVLRVHFEPDGFVSIMPFDTVRWFLQSPIYTKDVAEIPEWVQQRIAILMMVKPTEFIEGVGRRIDESTFWIYFEELNDTGSESKNESTKRTERT